MLESLLSHQLNGREVPIAEGINIEGSNPELWVMSSGLIFNDDDSIDFQNVGSRDYIRIPHQDTPHVFWSDSILIEIEFCFLTLATSGTSRVLYRFRQGSDSNYLTFGMLRRASEDVFAIGNRETSGGSRNYSLGRKIPPLEPIKFKYIRQEGRSTAYLNDVLYYDITHAGGQYSHDWVIGAFLDFNSNIVTTTVPPWRLYSLNISRL